MFFPSYNFLKFAKNVWKAGGTLDRFSAKREVRYAYFQEIFKLKFINVRCSLSLTGLPTWSVYWVNMQQLP